MRIRIKDHLWILGLGAAGLLILNIIFQVSSHKNRPEDLPLAEAPQVKDAGNNIVSSRVDLSFSRDKRDLTVKLELLGTIMGSNAAAFIFNPETQSSGLYKVKDNIDGFKVVRVSQGKVLLEKEGRTCELFLTSRRVQPVQDKDSFVSRDESGTMIISKFQIMAQMFKANEILSKIKIMPLPDAAPNKLKGFRVDNVPSGSIIEECGIENGDIIYSVQGQRMQSMQDALAMFNRIQSQSRVEVVLLRNDQPMTLKYEIRK